MRIGSGWKRKAKETGLDYIGIIIDIPLLGSMNLAIFKETEKKSDNSPDYSIVWSKPRKDANNGSNNGIGPNDDIPF